MVFARDQTLFGRTLLAKSLGLSQLIYTVSMLAVPESVIQETQSKLFAFLWKHKRDRIKRQVLVRPLSKGGLGFPCFRTAIKALRLSWIGRLLNDIDDIWKAPRRQDDHGTIVFHCQQRLTMVDSVVAMVSDHGL